MMKSPYHVFVYTKDVARGGWNDLVSCEETLSKARTAVDGCAGVNKEYQIAVFDPSDSQLTLVEQGVFSTNPRRSPTATHVDPSITPVTPSPDN